jgi:hypothetical protein
LQIEQFIEKLYPSKNESAKPPPLTAAQLREKKEDQKELCMMFLAVVFTLFLVSLSMVSIMPIRLYLKMQTILTRVIFSW